MPGGLEGQYLTAPINCVKILSAKCGHLDEPWILGADLIWLFKDGGLFQPCAACLANPRACVKQPQALMPMKRTLNKERPGSTVPAVPHIEGNGAVVFTLKRKSGYFLDSA